MSRLVNVRALGSQLKDFNDNFSVDKIGDPIEEAAEQMDNASPVQLDPLIDETLDPTDDQIAGAQRDQKILRTIENVPNMVPDVRNLPTPGGIALLLLLILFMVFAITPVPNKNYTRLGLVWRVLVGKASLPTTKSEEAEAAKKEAVKEVAQNVAESAANLIPGVAGVKAGAEFGREKAEQVKETLDDGFQRLKESMSPINWGTN